MLRIHFTTTDLNRIRWAPHPEPLMETVLSLQLLQQPQARSEPFARWSAEVGQSLGRSERQLFALVTPDDGTVPELLLAPTGAATLADALSAVRSKPAARAISDLAVTRSMRPDLPQWIADVHHGRPEATERLIGLLSAYHRLAVAPAWRYVEQAVRAAYGRASAATGAMLNGLHPAISWEFPILTVPCHIPHDVDVHLSGRGLLLIPAFFLRVPTARLDNYDEQAPIELYFPVRHQLAGLPEDTPHLDPGLVRLLGRTRAAALAALATVRSTAELATRVGISAATASHHLNALRAGGLITTTRERGITRHSLTHLGLRLLYGTPPAPGRPVAAFPPPAAR
ncbi:helix-turn-helix domain-containing protein [Kitasatospora sp. NPDC048540]|uniref:helix-turn-helix domain-containing protein n=1 Tax=Kitasatospora sp. NPDC048540 TaxID=3155634 RepID=UPI003408B9E5